MSLPWPTLTTAEWEEKLAQVRTLGGPGSGNFGHAGRPGEVGGSAAAGAERYVPPDTSAHPIVKDRGMWGSSHGNSSAMTGTAAQLMGIPGYKSVNATGELRTAVVNFLIHIADDKVGSEEPLYHGFQNTRNITFRAGDTLKLPLTATAGSRDDAAGYGTRLDRIDQEGEPTVFEFPKGTPMVAYDKWSTRVAKGDTASDAEEFGHVYSEAIVAGEYRVVKAERVVLHQPQHDSRPGQTWHSETEFNVVTLEPIGVFNPKTGRWRSRG